MAEVWIVIEHGYDGSTIHGVYDNEEAADEHALGGYNVERHVLKSRSTPWAGSGKVIWGVKGYTHTVYRPSEITSVDDAGLAPLAGARELSREDNPMIIDPDGVNIRAAWTTIRAEGPTRKSVEEFLENAVQDLIRRREPA